MFTVPGAIAKGTIDESEVSEELLEIISEDIEHFRTGLKPTAD
jgi:hypothetical protein